MPQQIPVTEDLNAMLENMRTVATRQLANLEAEIDAAQRKIIELKTVNASDCVNSIVQNLKARRNEAFKKLDGTMHAASSLKTYFALRNKRKKDGLDPSFYTSSKEQMDSYHLKAEEIALAFITDDQIQAYANAAAARFGCSSNSPPAAQLAESHNLMIDKLHSLNEARDELKKRIDGLFSVESQAKQLTPPPATQPNQVMRPNGDIEFKNGNSVWVIPADRRAA